MLWTLLFLFLCGSFWGRLMKWQKANKGKGEGCRFNPSDRQDKSMQGKWKSSTRPFFITTIEMALSKALHLSSSGRAAQRPADETGYVGSLQVWLSATVWTWSKRGFLSVKRPWINNHNTLKTNLTEHLFTFLPAADLFILSSIVRRQSETPVLALHSLHTSSSWPCPKLKGFAQSIMNERACVSDGRRGRAQEEEGKHKKIQGLQLSD